MTRFRIAALILPCLLWLDGCHSAFVQATVTNHSAKAIRLFEVDYPTASFGSGELAPGAVFRYRFKLLGDGPLKLTWTDMAGADHTSTGPSVREGVEGQLDITINAATADWKAHLR